MTLQTSNYGAARSILGLAEILLWCGIGLGLIVAMIAGGAASAGFGSSGLLAAIPGVAISLFCFVGIVLVQMSKATVDTADYTFQMLKVARDQLDVSKSALQHAEKSSSYAARQGEETAASPAGVTKPEGLAAEVTQTKLNEGDAVPSFMRLGGPTPNSSSVTEYRGHLIERSIHGFNTQDKKFPSLELAKKYIDGQKLKARSQRSNGLTS